MPPNRSSLEVVRSSERGVAVLKLSGVIDENLDQDALLAGLDGSVEHVVFDLGGVKRITSFGVRAWMRALERLEVGSYYFHRCRPPLMMQFATVVGFAVDGTLLTFYAPYLCDACGEQPELLLDLGKQYAAVASLAPPSAVCPSCSEALEFDEIPEDYFEYAASLPKPRPPDDVLEVIDKGNATRRAKLRIEQDVSDELTAVWLSAALGRRSRLSRLADNLQGRVVVVLQELTSADAEGLAQLRRLLSSKELSPVVARLPLALLSGQGGSVGRTRVDEAIGDAPLFSCLVAGTCSGCGDVALEVRASERESAEAPCPRCARPVAISLDGSVRARLTDAEDVTAYLDRQPTGPRRGRPSSGGKRWLGKYELLSLLGTGGMAEVYLARQSGLEGFERRVVIKRLLPHLARDDAFVQMFLQEARLAGCLAHPNIVQIYDVGRADNEYFLAMEYVPGWDLNVVARQLKADDARMPIGLAARIVADVAAALCAAHHYVDDGGRAYSIIHRDISPHNVLLSERGVVKLADFGIAKAVGTIGSTKTGQLKGKVIYMSPEQIHGHPDTASDVFAAGLVLFVLLTNHHPLQRETEVASLKAVLFDQLPDVREHRADVPDALAKILARALAREVSERYRSGRELAEDLERFLLDFAGPSSTPELASYLAGIERVRPQAGIASTSGITPTTLTGQQTVTVSLPAPLDGAPGESLPKQTKINVGGR